MQLEQELAALRLTPDEWITRRLGPEPSQAALDAARDPTEAALWEMAAGALVAGRDAILDFGFWSRAERDDYRQRAAALGASSRVHFVDAPFEVLAERLERRRLNRPPNTFDVSPDQLARWHGVFQRPTAEELAP